MPNGRRDDEPVLWGRWTEAHAALTGRLDDLAEQCTRQFARIEAGERAIGEAAADQHALEGQVDQLRKRFETGRERTWSTATILLTSLILPLLVVAISVWLHLRSGH